MWKQVATGIILAMFASNAFAYSCPNLMGEIDEALADDTIVGTLNDADLDMVRELRESGEILHDQGSHDASEAALNEARVLLGIDGS